MKRKYTIAIAAVVVFAGVAAAFALQVGGKEDALTQAEESAASSNVSLTIGDINSTSAVGGAVGTTSTASAAEGKNTTELTSIAPKSSSMPPAPVIDGAGKETSSGYTKATNPALTNPDKQPSYKETPVIDNGKKKSSSSSGKSSSSSKGSSSKSNSSKSSSSKPANGTKKDGMVYVDGFGWVKDEGGGGQGTVVNGDWGGGDQVGIME